MGMQDTALVPAKQIAVWASRSCSAILAWSSRSRVSAHSAGVRSKTDVRWAIGTIAPEPGRMPSASPAWARMSGSRVEANMQWGVSMKISAALIQL
jgi:hypothetical protein